MQKLIQSITTVFALLFILYSVIFAVTVNHFVSESVDQEVQRTLINVVSTIRPSFRSVEPEDLTGNTEEYRKVRQAIYPLVNLNDRILIYDADGNRLNSFGNDQLSNDSAFRAYEENMDNRFKQEETEKNSVIYSYSERISNSQGDVLGYIQVLRNFPMNRQVQEDITVIAVLIALGGVLVLGALLVNFNRRLKLPINSINNQLNRMSNNDYSIQYRPTDIEEFDEIGENINELSNDLALQEYQITTQTQQMNKLVDAMILGVVMVDKNHVIRLANPAVYEILALDEMIEGRRFEEVLQSYRLIQMISQVSKHKQRINEEIYLYYPKEVILDVNVIHLNVEDVQGNLNFEDGEATESPEVSDQVLLLLYDITDIRHLEKVRSDFISNASHELKTPVTALQGFSETLLDGALDDRDTAEEFVKIMLKESNRLGSLIKDILDLAKIEQDQIQHQAELLDGNQIIDEVFQHLEGRAVEKNIALRHLEISDQAIEFRGDKGRIIQILTNLIHNAIIYNNPDGYVQVTISEQSEFIRFDVADNGIGIPQEDLPRIFERFYRVSKDRSTASGGTGLGLAIVRNILENMGGYIEVESEFGKGTRFKVYIPIENDVDLEDEDDLDDYED